MRPFGIVLLAATLLAAGLAGLAASWAAWPRTPNTSPLAALMSLTWGVTYLVAASLTWRRSRRAAPAFLAAMGLLVPLVWAIFPGEQALILFPSFGATLLLAWLGFRFLSRAYEPVA